MDSFDTGFCSPRLPGTTPFKTGLRMWVGLPTVGHSGLVTGGS